MMLLFLAAGGAAGTLARYALAGWVYERTGSTFPWGTFAVNVVGSLVIGFTIRYLDAVMVTAEVRALLTIGLLGGFTTFSTYTFESVALIRDGEWILAAGYAIGSLVTGMIAVGVGLAAATLLLRV
ncbi:MAG: fluoride efflux transporter CrcB, partial [Alphaproteobacteria bacterium]